MSRAQSALNRLLDEKGKNSWSNNCKKVRTKMRYLQQEEVQVLRIPWTIPLFGKKPHTCVILISMCSNILQHQLTGNLNLSNTCIYFLFYFKSVHNHKNRKKIMPHETLRISQTLYYLSSWSPWEKVDRKWGAKSMSLFPWLCVWVICEFRHSPCSIYSVWNYHSIFILLFPPIKSFWDNESEVPIRVTFPQGQYCTV